MFGIPKMKQQPSREKRGKMRLPKLKKFESRHESKLKELLKLEFLFFLAENSWDEEADTP
ncbi:hypothetical protein KKF38_05470 [Patescibacteria group bacterium]|nr:hypothetical protein [Patescibacteria group bacterium]